MSNDYLYNREYIKRQMKQLEEALTAGKISEKEYDEDMQILIDRSNKKS